MTLEIRPFVADDLDTIKAITIAAFDGVSIAQNMHQMLGPIGGHDWTWHKARAIDEDVAHSDKAIFIAEIDGEVAGFITTRIDVEGSIGFIPNIAVHAEHRGQGVGRNLINYALQKFHDAGLTTAHIETLEQNPIGRHLYPDVGFREVARQIHYAMDLSSDNDQVG